jgi:hypothetical protein
LSSPADPLPFLKPSWGCMKDVIRVVSFLRFHGDISVQSFGGKESGSERFHLFWIFNSRSNLVVNKKDEILLSFTCDVS